MEAVAAGAAASLAGLLLGVGSPGGDGGDSVAAGGADGKAAATVGAGRAAGEGGSEQEQRLCCNALEALCHLQQGRAAVVEKAGLHAVAAALAAVPEAAAAVLKASGCGIGCFHAL